MAKSYRVKNSVGLSRTGFATLGSRLGVGGIVNEDLLKENNFFTYRIIPGRGVDSRVYRQMIEEAGLVLVDD